MQRPALKLFTKARREDAIGLAGLIYDIYIELNTDAKITNGQNNANQTKDK